MSKIDDLIKRGLKEILSSGHDSEDSDCDCPKCSTKRIASLLFDVPKKEYLEKLHSELKSFQESQNKFSIGDLIVQKDYNVPRYKFPIEGYPGVVIDTIDEEFKNSDGEPGAPLTKSSIVIAVYFDKHKSLQFFKVDPYYFKLADYQVDPDDIQ